MDHNNGYFRVPLHMYMDSRKYLGVFWKGVYYVLTVLPFGWKSSPAIYHSITEAVNTYVRSLGIPICTGMDKGYAWDDWAMLDDEGYGRSLHYK